MVKHFDDEGIEVSADTPIGKLAAKGMRVSDFIALLTLVGVCSTSFFMYQLSLTLANHEAISSSSQRQFATTIRLQTCILAMPQEKREQEYMSPNSFCRQMAAYQ